MSGKGKGRYSPPSVPRTSDSVAPSERRGEEDKFELTSSKQYTRNDGTVRYDEHAGNESLPALSKPATLHDEGASTAPVRPSQQQRNCLRKPPRRPPIPGQICYLPDGTLFPDSMIHLQKRQEGFFKHPALVVKVEDNIAHFYAVTKEVSMAIRELEMYLCIGSTTKDEGSRTLKLAFGSSPMISKSYVNLEQCYMIEWGNLDKWAADVRVNPFDLQKLWDRIKFFEAQQNRYIYKPLDRDMSMLQPGTIIMLPNAPNTSTRGAPVMILENRYPYVLYFRIKEMKQHPHFFFNGKHKNAVPPIRCLEISQDLEIGHNGTPVMRLEPGSPNMRERSYVELKDFPQTGNLKNCRTWCWPSIRISPRSLRVLHWYRRELITRSQAGSMAIGDVSSAGMSQGWGTHVQPSEGYGSAVSAGGTVDDLVPFFAMLQVRGTNMQPGVTYFPAGPTGHQTGDGGTSMAPFCRTQQGWGPNTLPGGTRTYMHTAPGRNMTGSASEGMQPFYAAPLSQAPPTYRNANLYTNAPPAPAGYARHSASGIIIPPFRAAPPPPPRGPPARSYGSMQPRAPSPYVNRPPHSPRPQLNVPPRSSYPGLRRGGAAQNRPECGDETPRDGNVSARASERGEARR